MTLGDGIAYAAFWIGLFTFLIVWVVLMNRWDG